MEVADKMNNYFVDSIKNLDIEPFLENNSLSCNIDEIISAYSEHPSVMKIKENVIITENFHSRNLLLGKCMKRY